jgi:hypothetical protein
MRSILNLLVIKCFLDLGDELASVRTGPPRLLITPEIERSGSLKLQQGLPEPSGEPVQQLVRILPRDTHCRSSAG